MKSQALKILRKKGKEILPPQASRLIEQSKLEYSPLGQILNKQVKLKKNEGQKQISGRGILKS